MDGEIPRRGNMEFFIQSLIKNEAVFLLVLARVASIMIALPFIGGRGIPAFIKAMLALSISLALLPFLRIEAGPIEPVSLAVGVVRELLLGLVIGLGVRFVFAAIEIGADMVGIQMGFGLANVFDPITNQQASIISQLFSLVVVLVFFVVNAHHIILQALVYSFEVIPPFGFYPSGPLIKNLIGLGSSMFTTGMKIAAPMTVALLLSQVAMGILSRVVPQMNIFIFSFPITIGVGLLVLGASVSLLLGLMQDQIRGLEGTVYTILIESRTP